MTQKELKQKYADILTAEVWRGSPRMVSFCVKEAAYIVELENGDIIALEKPKIETRFCFGYRDSDDLRDANAMADHAAKSTEYFMKENLSELDNLIDRLESENSHPIEYYIDTKYYNQPKDIKLKTMLAFYWHDNHKHGQPLQGINKQRVIDGYKTVRADFEKRLKSYLKRYGMSKVQTWSYWTEE